MTAAAPTSSKRIEANRRNAKRSTGPRTPEGKARVRLNALKHGLTAATAVLPGEDAGALEARVEAWKEDLVPRGALEDYLVERAAHVSWQLDRADRTIAARLTDQMRHHAVDREIEEADEVAELARRLFWDPRGPINLYPHFESHRPPPRISSPESLEDPLHPARTLNRLEATALGCRWLLDRWRDLQNLLEIGLKWTPPDRLRAIRLMGREPMDALEDDRVLAIYLACGAMDPEAPSDFDDLRSELAHVERERFHQRLDDRNVMARRPSSPEAGKALLLEMIDHAVTRLELLLRVHQERHAPDRPGVLDGLAFDDSEDGERLRRYQLSHGRTFFRAISTLFKVRKETGASGAESPDADAPSTPIEPLPGPDDETNPSPPDASLESRLQSLIREASGGRQPAVFSPDPGPPDSGLTPAARPGRALGTDSQAESDGSDYGETNPGPPAHPPMIPLDPCSEGRHIEPAIEEDPPLPIIHRPRKTAGARASRPNASGPIPPMMVRLLTDLVLRQSGLDGPPQPLPAAALTPRADAP